ncbi:MAG: hypothetical protein IKC39_00250 [Clostridia bacterium]|nr:hypothetical protein [Clostridia bacterium]
MYICKPERNVNQVRALVTICTLVTAILFLLSTRVQYYAALIRLAAFISLVASILLVVRYALTEFEYSVSAGDFSITKITGNRRQVVCNLALETAIDLIEKRDYDHLPKNEKAIIKYSLNQNMKANSFVFLCEFNKKRAMIEFEPNPEFVAILKNEMDLAKKNQDLS